ncbi:ATPase AAA [Allgaiera indica]|uniref:ATPase AAA n=1 Tax=Allgaiera indica TaxID=765699 RepID=A0AAN4UUM4_9RHOB|nr:AAA family ATPase [Allgaiera indica]GHE05278.1 ATPase AAA [Allgaiera indica]SDX62485.1 ATPase family associated with various cellular activities (AAA) [Allgaiera indica]
MPRIPFIDATLGLPDQSADLIEARLRNFHRKLLEAAARKNSAETNPFDHPLGCDLELDASPRKILMNDRRVNDRIRCRAKELTLRRKRRDKLSHLTRDERDTLGVLKDGVGLVAIPTEHRADELAAALHDEMPWMAPATEVVWHAMRRAVNSDDGILKIPPLILDGPPGIGKSAWARRLAEMLGVPSSVVEATNENAGFAVAGVQRGWSSATPGKPLQTILRSLVGNPIIIVDEIEKAGSVHSSSGKSHGLAEALLPLLEPASSRRWDCPYFRVTFDMSWISWVLTSNRQMLLPEPFLSRCHLVRLPQLGTDDLISFAGRQSERRNFSTASQDAIVAAIWQSAGRDQRMSLRTVIRMLDLAETLEARPLLH